MMALRQPAQLKKPFPARMSLLHELNNWEKRLMRRSSNRKARKRRARAQRGRARKVSFDQALHQFLTPQVYKQGHQAWQSKHAKCSWSLKAILWVLLLMTWGKGDSEQERFLQAWNFFVARHGHEKRPGGTWEGFQQALRRLPIPVFRALANGLRQQIGVRWLDTLRIGGWLPIGCDGSRLECPRSEALEKKLGQAGKDDSAPMVYVTALALLPLGLLWAWRLDKGTGNELQHLTQMLPTLPEKTLLVADAFYLGYDLYRSILDSGAAFLMRMSSRACLYSDSQVPLQRFREGWVHYWPEHVQEKGRPPLRLRLLRLAGKKGDVWLLTNLDKQQLPRRRASQIYRWRWRNEGLFRTFKGTLDKTKLRHRTPSLIFREAEGALLALQLLMAMTVHTMEEERSTASPRRLVLRIRGAVLTGIATLGPRQLRRYQEALETIHDESPERTSSKTRRPWPRRKPHKPPKPPRRRRLTDKQKQRMAKTLAAA
jgi:Transposase DDE domain